MKRKTGLIAPILLALTLCMLARPVSAVFSKPNYWDATGTGFVYRNGVPTQGSAEIGVNGTLLVTVAPHPTDIYNNTIWLQVYPNSLNTQEFWWTIVQTKVSSNGYITLYAAPLVINLHGNTNLANLTKSGPSTIIVTVSPPHTAPGLHQGQSLINVAPQYMFSFNVAYFYGWTTPI